MNLLRPVCLKVLVSRSIKRIIQSGHYALRKMRLAVISIFLQTLSFFSISPVISFSPSFCDKICYVTPWFCGICTSVHGSDFETPNQKVLRENLMPVDKAHLIQKAKAAHIRKSKIVGGTPVRQGESPWTVR